MTPETPLKDFGSLSVSGSTAQSKTSGLYSLQQSSDRPLVGSSKSIMLLLLRMGCNKSSRSVLKTSDLSAFKHEAVKYLPVEYNGDCIFELPPVAVVKEGGLSRLDGMDQKRDGHIWTETATTNISDPSGILTFKYVKCMGHLQCLNLDCRCVSETGDCNELYWSGSSPDILMSGSSLEGVGKYKLVCKYCKVTPSCLVVCHCKLFYVVSKDPNMSRACIHIGTHKHPVAKGDCRDAMDQIREEIKTQVAKTPSAKASAIGIAVGKELLMKGLINEDGDGKVLSELELNSILERWAALSSSTVENLIYDAKVSLSGGGYVDSILKLKKGSMYDYIQDSRFLGQGSDLVYIFKMSTIGPGSGVDLVRRMQRGGDLELQWVMFDHVKRISHWTTLGVHIYNPTHCKVMTICVCDMKSEMADHQKQMWRSMLAVMEKHGVKKVEFAGFMADSAQANFNAVREIFGSGDKAIPMKDKERTCQFHWSMALDRHTRQHIKLELHAMHKRLCHEYRKCKTKAAADSAMEAIKAWWYSSGGVSESSLKEMNDWLSFWHFRFHQWGAFTSEVSFGYLHSMYSVFVDSI